MKTKQKKVSVIIPAFNEEKTIQNTIKLIKDNTTVFEILVIDDGSTDQTVETAIGAGAIVIKHPYNKGNGAAIKTGIRRARGNILVLIDADGQHNPAYINSLLKEIDEYDMIVGARENREGESFYRNFGNNMYNVLASYITGMKILDLTSGFRVIRRDVALKFAYLLPNSFSYPTTITLSMIKAGYSVKYISTQNQNRTKGNSKIKVLRDGLRFFLIIFKITSLFSPMKIFLPISIFFFLIGGFNYSYTFIKNHSLTNMSVIFFIGSIFVFMLGLVAEQIAQSRMGWIDFYQDGNCRTEE